MGLFRLFLAIVVAYDHWRLHVLTPLGDRSALPLFGFNAGHAVLFFYVISGFLITYTLTSNYSSDAEGRRQFYVNRLIRIFSVYWPVAAFSVFIFGLPALSSATPSQVLIFGQDWCAVIGDPQSQCTLTGLEQSWTLSAELTFYLLAPFILRTWKIAAIICAASLLIRVGFLGIIGDTLSFPTWTYSFFPSTVCFFMFGQLACLAGRRWSFLLRPVFALLTPAILLLLPVILLFQYRILRVQVPHFDNIALWIPMALFVISLPAFFNATKNNRAMNYLGNLSYPLYLVHTFVLSFTSSMIVDRFWPLGSTVTLVAFLALSLPAALLVHELVEKPIAIGLRSLSPLVPRPAA